METPMDMKSKKNLFGICEWSLPCGPFAGVRGIHMAADIGFDGIQLGDMGGAEKGFPLSTDESLQAEYRETAEERGVLFQSLHLYTLLREGTMIYPRNSTQGESAMVSLRAGILACRKLGIPELSLTSGFQCEIKEENGFRNFAAMLNYACDEAEEYGIKIGFESILSVPEIKRMREETRGRIGVCYDTYNMLRFQKGDPVQDIEQLSLEDIDHFHLKDAPENNVGCALLGTGRGNFSKVAEAIRSKGYRGWLITENYYGQEPLCAQGNPEQLARVDLETMKRYFD